MSDWLLVDPRKLQQPAPRSETHRGMNLSVHVSPYDIPEAVKGSLDKRGQTFCIEFRYLDAPSHPHKVIEQGNVKINVDKRGRILSLAIPEDVLRRTNAENLMVSLQSAVTEMEKHRPDDESRENHVFASEVISGKWPSLLRDLVPSFPWQAAY